VPNDLIISFINTNDAGPNTAGACCAVIPYSGTADAGAVETQLGATLQNYTNSWTAGGTSATQLQLIAALKP
jgi:hypothetical protein